MKSILVYGSLKKGWWNHEHFDLGEPRNSHVVIKGYKLINLGAYPGAIESPNDSIVCECYSVDERKFFLMDAMERGAGYLPVDIKGCTLWVYQYPEATDKGILKNADGHYEWKG